MTEEDRLKRNAYMREWGRKNREKVAAFSREYRAKMSPEDKEKTAEYKRQWAKAKSPEWKEKKNTGLREHARKKRATPEGAEKLKAALDKYVKANRDLLNARNRERRKNPTPEQRAKKNEADRLYRLKWTPEQKAAENVKKQEWRRANNDRRIASEQKRRARKKGNGGSYTADEWKALKGMFNYSCVCCGEHESYKRLTVDHVIPLAKGGSNNIENLQPLCVSCNASKQDRIIDYRIHFEEAA